MSEQGEPTLFFAMEKGIMGKEPESLPTHPFETERQLTSELPVFSQLLTELRASGVPATTSEFLDLQRVLESGTVKGLDDLYPIARAVMVKDVTYYDKYDEVFARLFGGFITETDEIDDSESDTPIDVEQSKKKPQEKMEAKEEPKEENQSQDVVEQPGLTEEHHGGDDAHKAIKESPAAAKNGEGRSEQKREDNKGEGQQNQGNACGNQNERGQDGGGLKAEGEGGGEKRKEGTGGGDKKSENVNTGGQGSESSEKETRSGKGKEKKKKKKKSGKTSGKGGLTVSEKLEKKLAKREFKPFDKDEIINNSQFERVLARLTTIIKRSTDEPTKQLDVKATVAKVAQNGGLPELVYSDEEETKPSMILMFDVGGSTDEFRPIVEQLFKAATETMRELEIYYFHNAVYGEVWPANDGNYGRNFVPLEKILRREQETKVVIVGDAWMGDSDWMNGGLHDSADNLNRTNNGGYYSKTGYDNFKAIARRFPATVWINPIREQERDEMDNSGTIADLERVFPTYELTLNGLETAVQKLMNE